MPSTAQETPETKPLTTILKELQDRYKVRFNYASDLIEDIAVKNINDFTSLRDVINFLRESTGLDFVFLSDNVVSIKAKSTVLCGYVRDKDTNEPLSYTTVQCNGRGTVTNEEGFFELSINDASQIVLIRHIGHRTIRREARFFNNANCGVIHMVPEQQKLPEIVLSHYLIRGMDKLDNGSFQLDFDQFSILPGLVEKDVLQSVQALPGITSIDETVSNINIRGGSNDQNLILWDNIKMYQSGHFFGLISMYNPQITQTVALQKNGTSVVFTDGVSGTIAMSTDKNINPSFKGSLGINLIDANGFIDAPIGDNMSVQVGARKAISDFFETPTYSEYFDRIAQDTEIESNDALVTNSDIEFDFYDVSLRFLYRPGDKDFLRLNFIHTANEVVFNESAVIANDEEVRESSLDQTSIGGGIYYERKWNDRFETYIDVYETDYKLRAINANVLQDQRFLQENIVSETGARLVAQNELYENLVLRNGYHFVETKITNLDDVDDPIFRRLEGEVLRTHGIFTEVDWSSTNGNTSLNAGIRFNYLDKFNRQLWEPRLSLNQRFLGHFNLEVLGEFKHQNTSQIINFQNDFLGIEKRRWQLSNDMDIPVIQSKQGSVGISYQKSSWLVNAVGFYKEVDGITTQSQGFLDSFEFVRTSGKYDAIGLDFLLRKQLQKWSLWLSYGYLNSTYNFEELPEVEFRSNFDTTHSLTSGITFSTSKLNLALGANWRTGKPFTPTADGNEIVDGGINYGAANSDELDDYLRLDFSAIYTTKIGNKTSLRTGISIWNLLNRENPINTFFRVNQQNNAQQILQESLGITPNASVKLMFN
ncbi:MAG: TonB-dependent receptor [Muricauda sp.]|nr:carboxypeptidase-like regulatory domain-containing protein [Allomuricauda sp.]MAU25917.1 TonB-dependent receptor [Allomuricauda sp.]MBC31829.1 TonB-dependent receptor [Allomuricauda sp.]|tara:strand:+ start:44573 stop:47035 length:2463 start_codon:yes stop_codon:yes gene_type:complete